MSKRHLAHRIDIDRTTCERCAGCVSICPTRALVMHSVTLESDNTACIGCDLCVLFCPVRALTLHSTPAAV